MGVQYKKAIKVEKQPLKLLLKDVKKCYQLYLLMIIPIAYILVFKYQPMYGAQIAFKDFDATKGIWGSDWVGLKHFIKFVQQPKFFLIIKNTFMLAVWDLIVGFPVPILLALALNNVNVKRSKLLVQTVTYAPHFISTVVIVGMIIQLLHPRLGSMSLLLQRIGVPAISYMGKPEYFRAIYTLSGVWQGAGWGSIIYLAALSSVDVELYQASLIDGASIIQKTWYIDLPAVIPTIIILLILRMGSLMNVGFEKVYLMQNQLNLSTSEVISTYVYKMGIMSQFPNYSYATAIGLFNSVVSFILLIIVNAIARKLTETSLW
jgi:putative aldouronate transport system permease protein